MPANPRKESGRTLQISARQPWNQFKSGLPSGDALPGQAEPAAAAAADLLPKNIQHVPWQPRLI